MTVLWVLYIYKQRGAFADLCRYLCFQTGTRYIRSLQNTMKSKLDSKHLLLALTAGSTKPHTLTRLMSHRKITQKFNLSERAQKCPEKGYGLS